MSILLIILLIVVFIIPALCAFIGILFGLFLDFSLICYGIIRLRERIATYRKSKIIAYKHTQ